MNALEQAIFEMQRVAQEALNKQKHLLETDQEHELDKLLKAVEEFANDARMVVWGIQNEKNLQ